jgi:hypothetical protein
MTKPETNTPPEPPSPEAIARSIRGVAAATGMSEQRIAERFDLFVLDGFTPAAALAALDALSEPLWPPIAGHC